MRYIVIVNIIWIYMNLVCMQGCKTKLFSPNRFQISGGDQERLQKVQQSLAPPVQRAHFSPLNWRFSRFSQGQGELGSKRTTLTTDALQLSYDIICSPFSHQFFEMVTALAGAGSTVWPARKWLHRRTLWWPASQRADWKAQASSTTVLGNVAICCHSSYRHLPLPSGFLPVPQHRPEIPLNVLHYRK